jgi:Sec-independent protein secretion pathway component TatC
MLICVSSPPYVFTAWRFIKQAWEQFYFFSLKATRYKIHSSVWVWSLFLFVVGLTWAYLFVLEVLNICK